mgnify:CR=1 FL=1
MSTNHKSSTDDLLQAGLDSLGSMKEKVLSEEGLEELKAVAVDMADDAAKLIRKYPVRSVLGAFAAGILVGTLINRK